MALRPGRSATSRSECGEDALGGGGQVEQRSGAIVVQPGPVRGDGVAVKPRGPDGTSCTSRARPGVRQSSLHSVEALLVGRDLVAVSLRPALEVTHGLVVGGAEAQSIAPIVSVQNMDNLAHRGDDALIDRLADEGVAYTPFFPLGGFTPLQSDVLSTVAARLEATPMAVALAWLLRRSPNFLLMPGTSSVAHPRENIAGADLRRSAADIAELDSIAG